MTQHTLRPLKTKDIFGLSRLIKAMQLKFNFEEGMKPEEIGIIIMTQVIENLGDAEEATSAFLGDLVGLSADEFNELPLEETFDIIKQFKEIKGLSTLFTSATKLM